MNADLDWILNSPALMRTPAGITDGKSLCKQLDVQHLSSAHLPKPDNQRLGLYYEDLVFEILIQAFKNIRLERNIQVITNKITEGEFDFIGHTPVLDFHLECAVKFYLRVGSGKELHHYIGPGKKDRLDIKWARLLNHQLLLSDTDAGRAALSERQIISPQKALLLQGYLFHPLAEPVTPELAAEINPDHLKGWWVKPSQINLLDANSYYAVMEKPYWLAPKIESASDFRQLCLMAEQCRSPLLISRGHWLQGQWCEMDRGFLVPEKW